MSERVPPNDIEAELAVLGAILLGGRETFAEIGDRIDAEDFYAERCRLVFQAASALDSRGAEVDAVTVKDELKRIGALDAARFGETVSTAMETATSAASARHHADIVRAKAQLRGLIRACQESAIEAYGEGDDPSQIIDRAEQRVMSVRKTSADQTASVAELIRPAFADIASRFGQPVVGTPTGISDIDERLLGMRGGELIILAARPSMGKAQPLWSKVLTPYGFRDMGWIGAGDFVTGADGQPKRVIEIHPQGTLPIYELTFDDGTTAHSCADHRWMTSSRAERKAGRGPSAKSLREIMATLTQNGRCSHAIPYAEPTMFAWIDETLPIDPWLLGMFLGDGCSRSSSNPTVTNQEEDLIARIAEIGPTARVVLGDGRCPVVRLRTTFKESLRELGLMGLGSHEKFIPRRYQYGSIETRLAVLRGLLDSDGHVVVPGTTCVEYVTTSEKLRDDVMWLVRSLGGRITWTTKESPAYTHRGEVRHGRDAYRCTISFNSDLVPVSSEKHLERYRSRTRPKAGKFIRSVRQIESDVAQCLTVEGGLYVTDDFNVTHNSSLALTIAGNVVEAGTNDALVFSLEVDRRQVVENTLASRAQINTSRIRGGDLTEQEHARGEAAAEAIATAPRRAYVNDKAAISLSELRAVARRLAGRPGVNLGVIVVDYLQLMRGDSKQNRDGRQSEVAEISQGLKALARELRVPVLALSQLSRQVESREEKRPRMSDLRDSGSLEQDADVVMLLYRESYYNRNVTADREPICELNIAKNRSGPCGVVKLWFAKQYLRFSSVHKQGAGND